MRKHYDVAVLGCWWGANYGSELNGYAVYKSLKAMGQSVLMVHKHIASENDWEFNGTHNARFIKKFYPEEDVSPVIPLSRLHELNQYCDTFLTGSDQVWNYGIFHGFGMAFMQNFVNEDKKKISFGTSFGRENDTTPPDKLPYAKSLLQRFNAISVRENSGVDICRDVYGVKAIKVVEPVFCLTTDEYKEIAEKSEYSIPDNPYIVTYMLDPTPEKRQAILNYCELTGMRAINILDGDPRFYRSNQEKMNLPDTFAGIGAEDFLKLYMNASFVISDSFHGTAFAIIFGKPFISIINHKRGAVRFPELLGTFGLTDRMVDDPNKIPVKKSFLQPFDRERVEVIMAQQRKQSLEWLEYVIKTPVDQLSPVTIADKAVTAKLDPKWCTGCAACVNCCPTQALSLKADAHGYYRSVIDASLCINCGKCTDVCPALALPVNTNRSQPSLYEFIAADPAVLKASSSGGVFSLLARQAFKKKGWVAGAAWRDDFSVEHILIQKEKDLSKLQKSKYLQSYTGNILKEVKEKLDANEFVLFSGCPCQVTGLKAYLGRDYDNLLTVDLLCGNAPSALFFQKYLQDEFPDGIHRYEFRTKDGGKPWDAVHVKIEKSLIGKEFRSGPKEDGYQRVYHNHTMCPPHCEQCKYQSIPRFGDITIGDFWWIDQKDPAIQTHQGVSAVLCNNNKGKAFFEQIPSESVSVRKQVPLTWLGGNGHALPGAHNWISPKRDAFYRAIQTMPFNQAVNYALKPNHGNYREIYKNSDVLMQYDRVSFRYDSAIWKESHVDGKLSLSVIVDRPGLGKHAGLAMTKQLESGKRYRLRTQFKVNTQSEHVNLHVKDSGSNLLQMIHSCYVKGKNSGQEWITVDVTFVPDCGLYDEFTVGASQISGVGNFIIFDYVYLTQEK